MHGPSFLPYLRIKICNFASFLPFLKIKPEYILKTKIFFFFPITQLGQEQLVKQLWNCSIWYACTLSACLGISRVQSLLSFLGMWIYHLLTQVASSKVMITPGPCSSSKTVTSSGTGSSRSRCNWCSVFKITIFSCIFPTVWTKKYCTELFRFLRSCLHSLSLTHENPYIWKSALYLQLSLAQDGISVWQAARSSLTRACPSSGHTLPVRFLCSLSNSELKTTP